MGGGVCGLNGGWGWVGKGLESDVIWFGHHPAGAGEAVGI